MSTDGQQKRGGLVPIGKVAVRLPGMSRGAGVLRPHGARQHFTTLLKQVNQLTEASGGGAGNRLHGAAPGPVFPAAHESDGIALQYVRRNGPYVARD